MRNIRLIAKLEIKPPNLVKGIQFEGLRKLGDPNEFAKKYYNDGVDEIIYDDIVASLYERNSLEKIIEETSKNLFIPITVSGGIRSIENINSALRSGADKVAINTAAIKDSSIIKKMSDRFGSSTIVLSLQAKKVGNSWEAYYDNGRERSFLNAIDWAKCAEDNGIGEILVTSIDNDGAAKGFDIDLVNTVMKNVSVPVIASGGMGKLDDIDNLISSTSVDAIAFARCLHYNQLTIGQIRDFCISKKHPIRRIKNI